MSPLPHSNVNLKSYIIFWQAFQYYSLAAAGGHPQATYNLALLYLNGQEVKKDTKFGFELLEKAAELGVAQVCMHLVFKTSMQKSSNKIPDQIIPDQCPVCTWSAFTMIHTYFGHLYWIFPYPATCFLGDITCYSSVGL